MSGVPLTLTWRHAMQILIAVIDNGNDNAKAAARDELLEIADHLDAALPGNAPTLEVPDNAMTWEQWRRAVTDKLIASLEIPNGDAQSIVEALAPMATHLWHADYSPAQAATAIAAASTVDPYDANTARVYVENGGSYCPECDSQNVNIYKPRYEHSEIIQDLHCLDCKAQWTEHWILDHVTCNKPGHHHNQTNMFASTG